MTDLTIEPKTTFRLLKINFKDEDVRLCFEQADSDQVYQTSLTNLMQNQVMIDQLDGRSGFLCGCLVGERSVQYKK